MKVRMKISDEQRANFENQVMDVLMDGPASISDLALDTGLSHETAKRIVRHLQFNGLVETYGLIPKGNSLRPVMFFQMARTRKAA